MNACIITCGVLLCVCCLVTWLAGWPVDWLAGWLVGCIHFFVLHVDSRIGSSTVSVTLQISDQWGGEALLWANGVFNSTIRFVHHGICVRRKVDVPEAAPLPEEVPFGSLWGVLGRLAPSIVQIKFFCRFEVLAGSPTCTKYCKNYGFLQIRGFSRVTDMHQAL